MQERGRKNSAEEQRADDDRVFIHVSQFERGDQGVIRYRGTIRRRVRRRELYTPYSSGCESNRFGWAIYHIVRVSGVDISVTTDNQIRLPAWMDLPRDLRKANKILERKWEKEEKRRP